jgi:NitT/TauT family transport system substrate-binding protein
VKKFLTVLALFTVLVIGALVVRSVLDNETDSDLTTIRLSEVTRSVFYAPLYAAIELGFFEDEGIVIDLVTSDGADNVMAALLSGAADIGLSGPEAAIYVYTQGRADYAVVFAGLTARDGSFLIGRSPDFTWDDLRDAHILPGRRGGMPFMVFENVLRDKGLTDYVEFDNSIQFAAMVGSFFSGNADFVTAFEPVASTIELEGRGYVVASMGEETGELPYTAFYALGSFINANPDLVQRFTNAIARGQDWVAATTPYIIAEVIAPFFPGAEMEILASAIGRYQAVGAYALTPAITPEAFYLLQEIMIAAGELTDKVPFETLINNYFAENVPR